VTTSPDLASAYARCLDAVQRLAQAGQLPAAIAALRSFVDAHPGHAEGWNDLAALHHTEHQLEPARQAAQQAVALEGANGVFRHTLATILFDGGNCQAASDVLGPLLAAEPRHLEALILAGEIMQALGRASDARWFFGRALEAHPASVRAAEKMAATAERPAPWWTDHLREGDLVFDVGANVGDKTAEFLARGARVVACEPLPQCLAVLARKFADNDRVAIVGKGLSDRAGKASISVCNETTTLSTLSEQWKSGRFANYTWGQRVDIELCTLDELIDIHGLPHYCKVDVEGYEVPVLQGLSRPIPLLSFEYTIEFLENTARCLEHLAKLGYRQFNLSLAEQKRFHLPGWVSAQEIVQLIEQSRDPGLWGDIYAHAG
jgi:FkbM family methyltransferase